MPDVAVDTLLTTAADIGHPWSRLGSDSDTSSTYDDE
jgi:hypothetical protein